MSTAVVNFTRTGRRAIVAAPGATWPFVAFGVLFVVGGLVRPSLFGLDELFSTVAFAMILAVVSAGQTIVVLQGGIDLSVPNTLTIAALAFVAHAASWGWGGALGVAVAIGLAVGVANGVGVTRLGISPIVMTIAMNGLLFGALLLAFSVSQLSRMPGVVTDVTSHQVTVAGVHVAAVVFLGLALLLVLQLMLSFSGWGRLLHVVGAAPDVARFAGVPVTAVRVSAYAVAGVLAAFSGVVVAGFFAQTAAGMGDPYLLGSVAAVVVGGASIFGGRATVFGTLGGALVLQQVSTLLGVANLGVNVKQIVYGAIVLVVVALYGRDRFGQ